MVEEVTSLKKDFKQKENKYLEEFLDMNALKEKVEDNLYKQDQSLQTVYMLCKLKLYYNEQNKVAIGNKNPLCLTCAKQVQPTLYNGYEIIKNNHVPALVHNTEDTLEIAEITRRKMNEKIKDPKCVTHKVKIAPPDYSKENYLVTFTPQKQLTLEQIFWSQDLIKMKEEALKKQTTASRPIKVLTVYPPNTPATLVPRVLPTKSQECYLTEVIPFFNTRKEHFEGIQKALTKEIKEMKNIFEELEAEVDQNVVHRKHAELTVSRFTEMHDAHSVVQARCLKVEAELSKLRDKIQTDDHNELVNRFSNLEVNHLNLQLKYQNLKESFGNNPPSPARETPDFDSVFVIGKMKASLQDVEPIPPHNRNNREVYLHYLKHLKESVETLCEIVEESLRKKQVTFEEQCDTSNSNIHKHVEQQNTQKTNVPMPPSTGVNCCTNASGSQPRSNTKKNRISPAKLVNKKKVKEHPRTNKSNLRTTNRVDSSSSSKRTVINSNSDSVYQTCNKCLISANHDVCVVDYLQSVKASPSIHNIHNVVHKVKQVWKPKQVRQVVQIVLWYLDSGCSKHMTGDRSRLRNFMKKFIGTVRFGNDHFGAIMGYGDYVIGDSVISRVYYVEGLGHNLFFVRQFCDSDLEVAFRKHSCYVRDTDDVELIKGSHGFNLYTISIEDKMKSSPICLLSKASKNKSWLWHHCLNHLNFGTINDLVRKDLVRDLTAYYERVGIFHQKTVPRTPQQNDIVERQNRTLVEAARTMLIFSKAPMFLWAKDVATACYTQNQSLIHTLHNKTPYELVHAKKTDLTFFRVFGALCYLTNDSEDLGKLQPTADIGYSLVRI
ncbi:retrovirus-related pol polyprotein from transposon TNT 1-94 [Tanacetum coccineum]